MALRKIVTVGDPILTKVCRPVTKFDQKLAILIEDMMISSPTPIRRFAFAPSRG